MLEASDRVLMQFEQGMQSQAVKVLLYWLLVYFCTSFFVSICTDAVTRCPLLRTSRNPEFKLTYADVC